MDIKKLRLLADVAKTGNFTRTGDRMGYTQSGVSHILRSLEEEMGFSLFVRSRQGVKLTSKALAIMPSIELLLEQFESLERNISELKTDEQ